MAMRSARPDDVAPLADLWRAAGLRFRAEHVDRELSSVLARDPGLVIVADEAVGVLAGSVFGTFDRRRGWLNRLATRPSHRGNGLATALVGELERRLLARGCAKVNLLIEPATPASPASTRASATSPTT
jgi:GNAT superfamily N-acetyltransferase